MATAAAVTHANFKTALLNRSRALGNTGRGLKEVCSDLVNEYLTDGGQLSRLAAGTFLSEQTLYRVSKLTEAESGEPYKPNADTLERILRFFGAEVHFKSVTIRGQYFNKPKS